MNILKKYIDETLGIETTIIPLKQQLAKQLPLYITAVYNVQQTAFYGRPICLLIANTENTQTPAQLHKQMQLVEQKTGLTVVFVFEKVISYNIKRMIQVGLNFIIPNKQLFIPALMMDLRKMPATIPLKTECLTPIAQLMLLYHLQKRELNNLTTQQLSDKFNQTYLKTSRAVKNLEALGLCNLTSGKEKKIQFTAKGKELWLKAQSSFQNPIERVLFTDELLTDDRQAFASNINALAHYSMLNDETKRYYAIGKNNLKSLAVETNKYAGDNTIEVWRYNPDLLSDNGFIDRLSLYLIFKNDSDERVQTELEQLINEIQWSKE
jgi:DNA-binding MarR family transcriptional regulator